MIAMVTLTKGLKNVGVTIDMGLGSSFMNAVPVAALIGVLVALAGAQLLHKIHRNNPDIKPTNADVERVFAILMVFTACAMAFAHGSNDVANAIGPMAAIVGVLQSGGEIAAKSAIPWWILLTGALGIVIGLATYGWKVIQTIGKRITELTPSRGFAAELGAASTVVLASATGLPISTTHTLVGAVLGVGIARGIGSIDLRVVGSIFASWLVTLPAGAGLSIVFFFFFKGVFSG
jgi:inorganic phosphate transporter, PiT family